MDNPDNSIPASEDEELLNRAKSRFKLASEAEIEIRKDALEDFKFAAGEQWPDDVKMSREIDRRPCITINRIPQFIRQITNDQRQNRPSIKVSPIDDDADVETAKIFQGLIRHIEYSSDADTAYDTAFDSAVRGGFGYYRIVTEYSSPTSFEQDIKIKRIRNRFSVYLDPNYLQPDGSDSNWGFIFEDIPIEEYKSLYPTSRLASMTDWNSIGDSAADWMTSSNVRVAEYFYKEFKQVELVLMSDGTTYEKEKIPEDLPEGVTIQSERTAQVPEVKWCKLNAVEVLEKRDWPGQWIPIIPVLGDELDIDGRKILEGVVRHAKDPQRMYNYWASSETETIALAPRAPWIGFEGQFEGHEEQWKTANIRNHAYLEVKPKTIGGVAAPLPQRNVFEPPVQAITQARAQAADDMKATTGIYDASLGNKGNEQSGIAIQRRNIQSQTSNFHFMDNLTKSLRHGGRICIDLIPHVYDTARAIRILHPDGTDEIVLINQAFVHNGKPVTYSMGAGRYDVVVDTGPSFETKRQEAVTSMIDLSKSFPQLMQVAGDLMVKNMDWNGAQEIADRIKRTLPPGLAADEKNPIPIPPQAQALMGQMHQTIQQLTQALNAAQSKINAKAMEIESKERIALASIKTDIEITLAKLKAAGAETLLEHQIGEIQDRLSVIGQDQPVMSLGQPGQMNAGPNNQFQNPGAGPQRAALPNGNPPQPTGGQTPGSNMGS